MTERNRTRAGRNDDAEDLTRRTVGTADASTAAAGAAVGAVGGAVAGPAGALVGGAVGGLVGFLAGKQVRDAPALSAAEDDHYRRVHEATSDASMPYGHVRDLYRFGHVVRESPAYSARNWAEIEPELRAAWTAAQRETWGEWPEASRYVRQGYETRPG